MSSDDELTKAASVLAKLRTELKEPHLTIARALRDYGSLLLGGQQIEQGLSVLIEARDMTKACPADDDAEAQQRPTTLCITLHYLGEGFCVQRDYARAIAYYQEGLQHSKELVGGSLGIRVLLFTGVADAFTLSGSLGQALQNAEKAKVLSERLGKPSLQVQSLYAVAKVQAMLGEHEKVIQACEQALPLVPPEEIAQSRSAVGLLDLLVDASSATKDLERLFTYMPIALPAFLRYHGPDHPKAGWYLHTQARVCLDKGELAEAVELARAAVRFTIKASSVDDPNNSNNSNNNNNNNSNINNNLNVYTALDLLGDTLQASGQFRDAIETYQLALGVLKQLFGDVPTDDAASTLGSLATAYHGADELLLATKHFEQSTEMLNKLHGNAPHPQRVPNLTTSGSIYVTLCEYERAIDCFQKAWAIGQQLPNRTAAGDASLLQNLGSAHLNLGAVDKAIDYMKKAQTILQEAGLGEGNPYSASLNLALAGAYDEAFKYDTAFAHCQKGLDEVVALYKPPDAEAAHPEISQALMTMGGIVLKTGDLVKARGYFEQSLACDRRIYGQDVPHGHTITKLINMNELYDIMGDLAAGTACLQEAEELLKRLPDESARAVLQSALAQTLVSRLNTAGRFKEAKQRLEESLQLAASEALRIDLISELSGSCYGLGEYQQALELLTEVLVNAKEHYGDAPNVKMPMIWEGFAECHSDLGDLDKAHEYCERAITMISACIPDRHHPLFFEIECCRADVFSKLGRLDDAQRSIAAAQYATEKLVGASGFFPAEIARQQGNLLKAQGNWSEAILSFNKALELIRPLFGNSLNPLCRKALVDVGDCYFEIGELTRAKDSWQLVLRLLLEQSETHSLLPALRARLAKLDQDPTSNQPAASSSSSDLSP